MSASPGQTVLRRPVSGVGFTLVSALFLLVVLSALAAYISSLASAQHRATAGELMGVRAYEAARAGLEWGLYAVQATPAYNFSYGPSGAGGTAGSVSPDLRQCPASPVTLTWAGTQSPSLAAFSVTVTCSMLVDTEGGPAVYRLNATACSEPGTQCPGVAQAQACPNTTCNSPGYVERRVEVSF